MAYHIAQFIPMLFVKLGAKGILFVYRHHLKNGSRVATSAFAFNDTIIKHFPARKLSASEIVSVTGAGDR
jgi:sugar/nucleoside kinase (ribokinase family)